MLGAGTVSEAYAQSGGRKKEKRIKTKRRGNYIHGQYKSQGHADEFARGSSGRRGRFVKLFFKPKPSWRPHKSSRASNNRDNINLFERVRQKGHVDNSESQTKQNFDRTRHRDRGNKSFRRRKYQKR